jgi:hypothetical protein
MYVRTNVLTDRFNYNICLPRLNTTQRSRSITPCAFQVSLNWLVCSQLFKKLLCLLILCSAREAQACAKNVIVEQCGEEIAVVLDGLADRVRTAAGCPTSRLRSTAHMKRQGITFWKSHCNVLHLIELTSRPGLTWVNSSSKQGFCASAQVHCCELQAHTDRSRIQRSNQYAVQRK